MKNNSTKLEPLRNELAKDSKEVDVLFDRITKGNGIGERTMFRW